MFQFEIKCRSLESLTLKIKMKVKYISKYETFYKFSDSEIAEMAYDPVGKKTFFLVRKKKGKVETCEKIPLGEVVDEKGDVKVITLKPLPAYDDWIETDFVKFPSSVGKYKNEYELYKQIKKFISSYIVLPDDFTTIATVYVMMSWLYDKFQTLPYLRVIGMYSTGKSRFLSVVGSVCYRPMIAGGSATPASLFRTVDKAKGTFILDEADYRNSEMSAEIIKILNSGYGKGMPVVRMEIKKNYMVAKAFQVYGPKILASRERFSDNALESRCLTQYLLPKKEVSVPIHLPKNFQNEARNIRNKLLAFRFKHYDTISEDESSLPDIEFLRLREIALSLTSIAKLINKDVLQEVCKFLKFYESDMEIENVTDMKADILKCIINLLEHEGFVAGKLRMSAIACNFHAHYYNDYSDRKTRTYEKKDRDGNADEVMTSEAYIISPRKIGSYVKQLNIKILRDGDGRYIPVLNEYLKIKILARRYGLDKLVEMPEKLKPASSNKLAYSDQAENENAKIF